MRIKPLRPDFIMPTKGTEFSGAFDVYMPDNGDLDWDEVRRVPLGFAAEVPQGCVALILPRSGMGSKYGLELNNTCGVIDSDYRGEWIAFIKTKQGEPFAWKKGERCLQFLIVPVMDVLLELSEELSDTARGKGGFGSTSKGL